MSTTIFTRLFDAILDADMDEFVKQSKLELVKHYQKLGFSNLNPKDKQELYTMYGELV